MMALDLPLIWAGLIALAVLIYVMLDGYDLGVGILFPTARSEQDRKLMMNSIAPVWDGNETWIVLSGGGLFAVFPLAYAIVMPALYVPVIAMLLGLVFRGVSFEYRWRSETWRPLWDRAFFAGSTVAALCQGIIIGALLQGVEVQDRAYAGGWFDWLTPFSVFCGLAVVVGYALLGATWLILKTEGDLQKRMRGLAHGLGAGTLALIAAVTVATLWLMPIYSERWFTFPAALYSYAVPVLLMTLAVSLYQGLLRHRDLQPFLSAQGLFIACFIGIVISFYPQMIPPSVSLYAAAAPDDSLAFALVGAVVLLPMILAYTGYSYWVFRGKIDPDEGYH